MENLVNKIVNEYLPIVQAQRTVSFLRFVLMQSDSKVLGVEGKIQVVGKVLLSFLDHEEIRKEICKMMGCDEDHVEKAIHHNFHHAVYTNFEAQYTFDQVYDFVYELDHALCRMAERFEKEYQL